MRIIRSFDNSLTYLDKGSVVTIGNFDGVHKGHQQIIELLLKSAERSSLPAIVILFEPQTNEVFSINANLAARLYRLRDKLKVLEKLGVSTVSCLHFNRQLRQLSASKFVSLYLHQYLRVKKLIIGDDFCFGKSREGNYSFLHKQGKQFGFTVHKMPSCFQDGDRVSSSRIRQLLHQGKLAEAKNLLGRPFHIAGRVIYGQQLGQKIGVPTANVSLLRKKSPLQGVYAVKVKISTDKNYYNGVANAGNRPTVDGNTESLEIHLFGFDRNIYGAKIKVIPLIKIRNEKKFESVESLKTQINNDIKFAHDFFHNRQ